jgi:drug/metabolite transporter (DMT)-like permease
MKIASVPNPWATAALGVFFLVANMIGMVYAVRRIEPSGSFLLLYYLGAALVVAHWIIADSRRLNVPSSVDQGWFLIAAWPICLPYHLFKTRHWRGVVTLAGLLGLYAVTYGISLAFFYALRHAGSGE